MKKFFPVLAAVLLLFTTSCSQVKYEKVHDGVVITFPKKQLKTRMMKVRVVTDKIIQVTATCSDEFSKDTSIMALNSIRETPAWVLADNQEKDHISVQTSLVTADVNLKTGQVVFYDSKHNVLLSECKDGGKTFVPMTADSISAYNIRQEFDSPDDEAFYGLGQHQHGWLNLKGKDVDLTQLNSYACVPFLMSNKHYGILWDNYSITRFGDPRDFEPISKLKLISQDGVEGGLIIRFLQNYCKAHGVDHRIRVSERYEKLSGKFQPR